MVSNIKISIPKPCNENWEQMTSIEKGNYCLVCKKNVLDLTKSTDRQIVKIYNENKNLCGMFTMQQIGRNLVLPKEHKSFWMVVSTAIVSFLGIGNHTIHSQETSNNSSNNKIEIAKDSILNINKEKPQSNKKRFLITGVVTDGKDPIPGVAVTIKGKRKFVYTDSGGKYAIEVKKNNELIYSFIGMKSIVKKIGSNSILNVSMTETETLLGEVVIEINN
jgi:hypothetical protein